MRRQNERLRSMNKKTLWVCRTAVMIAVLVALQFATKAMGQFVTGSCVNMVLVVATLCGGFWCGFATALVSPFLAYLLGIGPALIQLVPAIALGNISLVAIYALIYKKVADKVWLRDVLAVVLAAAVKLAVLFLLIVKILIPLLALPDKQAAMMSAMFSWPQLVTALIGGFLGTAVSYPVKKATSGKK